MEHLGQISPLPLWKSTTSFDRNTIHFVRPKFISVIHEIRVVAILPEFITNSPKTTVKITVEVSPSISNLL